MKNVKLAIIINGMLTKQAQQRVVALAQEAGITINGNKPWDMQIHNERFYPRLLLHGSLGLGESYMDGWWDVERLDDFFARIMRANLSEAVGGIESALSVVLAQTLNLQTQKRSKHVAELHYDLGNEFYRYMLDTQYMQYTCGYWKHAKTLQQAQIDKLDLVCRKLQLKKGEHVLELGCGWGGFAKYAAKHYGVSVTGYNISKEQVAYARASCKGLPVEIVQADYRTATGSFDKVVSIGMCEHVGYKNYQTFMRVAHRTLKDRGLFLTHTIGTNISTTHSDPWLTKYIFPGSMLPSVAQLSKAAEQFFVVEDWHNFGADYDTTLMAWHENFEKNWHHVVGKSGFDERFRRMWRYYLLSCAGLFRARSTQLWQVVFSKNGIPGGYTSVR